MAYYSSTHFINTNNKRKMTVSTIFTLNASHFGQGDLKLFIESLETIYRLEKNRHERRQRQRIEKRQQTRVAKLDAVLSHSPTPSVEEAVDEPVMYLEAKCIPYATSENLTACIETGPGYYTCEDVASSSASQSSQSSASYCSCRGSVSVDSDSAESGIYGSTCSPPIRPRSQRITASNRRSTRSRIIGMVLKQDIVKLPSSQRLGEPLRDEYSLYLSKSRQSSSNRFCSFGDGFLNKALRYLTL